MESKGVIIVAGGSGSRMGAGVPKQFLPLGGRPMLVWSLETFHRALPGAKIVLVLAAEEEARWSGIVAEFGVKVPHTVCRGGAERFHSVRKGLAALGPCDIVAVHDGARPLVSGRLIKDAFATAACHGSAVPAIEPADSFRIVRGDGAAAALDRKALRAIQTPQVFRYDLLVKAYETPFDDRFTDDASVFESAGHPVALCRGERRNIKITTPEDLALAEILLKYEE